MISFDSFIAQDGVPIYLQIVKHIKSGIVSGTIISGDEVPSRRVLSALLGVNPNTIQKAYGELEREGFIYSVKGRGNFVSSNKELVEEKKKDILKRIKELVDEGKAIGLTKEEIISFLEWKEDKE